MASVWGELKRRNVVKVAVAYAIVGWLLIEVSTTVLPLFEAPDWIAQVFAFFVILGFPLALVLSWAYEITPEGIKLERDVAAGESITHVTGRKLDFAIIGALVLALGFVVYNYVLQDSADETPEVAVVELEQAVLPNSVAVLPFENLSPDPDNAYFAAGMHEEILNQLTKLRNLNVISRTSVLQYAENRPSLPQIAAELNVQAILEGSVRFDGENVLVQAQLIDAATDSHLWSDRYERELAGVFAIQADVAMNIANAVGAEFSVEEQASIEKIPTSSPEAYDLYLRALRENNSVERQQYLDQAISLDPQFALAYARKAFDSAVRLYFFGFGGPQRSLVGLERAVLDNADKAVGLDQNIGLARTAQAIVHEINWRWASARQAYEQALQLSPNDTDVLIRYAEFRRAIGEYSESVSLMRRAAELSPLNAQVAHQLGVAYMYTRNNDAALSAYGRALELTPGRRGSLIGIANIRNAQGRFAEAIEALQTAEGGNPQFAPSGTAWLVMAYANAGSRAEAERHFGYLEEMAREQSVGASAWAMAYLALGDADNALMWLQQAVEDRALEDTILLRELKANIWGVPLLDTPAFQELRDRIGAIG